MLAMWEASFERREKAIYGRSARRYLKNEAQQPSRSGFISQRCPHSEAKHYFLGFETLNGEEAIRYLPSSLSTASKNKFACASSP
jgi:hypothetical protein